MDIFLLFMASLICISAWCTYLALGKFMVDSIRENIGTIKWFKEKIRFRREMDWYDAN